MIIEKIEIGSFGKLDNMTLELSSGVNIIRGANESGKSTICNFIKFIFYGLPQKLEDRMKLISWNTSSCRGAITFLNDDNVRYRAERDVVCTQNADGRPAFRERAVIFNATTGEQCFKGENAGEVFFGVTEHVFDSTVYIRQLYGTKAGDKSLCEAAENILFSGSESINTKKAQKKLDEARVFLYHKNKKGGKIYELDQQSQELEEKLEGAKEAGNEIIYLEGSARLLAQKKDESEARAKEIKSGLDEYEMYSIKKAYLKYKDELRTQKELSSKIEALRFSEQFNNATVYTDEYISNLESMKSSLAIAEARLDESKKRFETAKQRVFDMREKIDVFERFGKRSGERDKMISDAAEINEKLCGLRTMQKASIAACAVTLAAFVLFLMLWTFEAVSSIAFAVVFCVLLMLSLASFITISVKMSDPDKRLKRIYGTFGCLSYAEFDELVKAASHDEAVMTYITDERDAADGAYKAASDKLDEINNTIVTELESANFAIEKNTVSSIDAAIAICREQKAKLDKLLLEKNACDARISEIEKTLNTYDDDHIKSACTKNYDSSLDEYDYQAHKREFELVSNLIKSQTDKLHEIEVSLSALTAKSVKPAEIAAIKAAVDSEHDELISKHEAYVLALDAMTAASGKLRDGLAPKIAKSASKVMRELSGGKYATLGVNSDFEITFSADTISHSVDFLSAGTSDIAYISFRIALLDVLFKKSIPPFIFDESFMRMDNDRMTNSLTLLCKLGSSGTQSLLFTCHGREEKLMKTIGEYTYFTI